MASELTISATLSVYKPSVMPAAEAISLVNQIFNMSGNPTIKGYMAVTTAALAIPLGNIANPNYFIAVNLDPTNFIRIMNGSGGAKVVKLRPNQFCLFPWDETGTPYAQADTASCEMYYLLCSL